MPLLRRVLGNHNCPCRAPEHFRDGGVDRVKFSQVPRCADVPFYVCKEDEIR